ncbi:MAG: carotenoid biosynthesis protein [Gemmatimonadales bacterium]|nr:carotenoid biosynthesis protein [Gemmatimonadales bacterium]
MAAEPGGAAARIARAATWSYGILTAWGLLGLLLVGRAMPGVPPEVQQRAMAWGMLWVGQLTLWSGFLAAVAALAVHVGRGRALRAAAGVVGASLALELVGAKTGFPFGEHGYGTELGLRVLGLIPLVIPLSWFLMLYACTALALRLGLRWPATLAAVTAGMLAWDVLMEPAMSRAYPFWQWRAGAGVWYGMPLANLLTWVVWVPVIGSILRWLAGEGVAALARDRTAVALYVLTAITPLALAVRYQLWAAVLLGGGAMVAFLALPLARSWRAADAATAGASAA